jgi:ABC-type dipeptide/oligopeptide/nickel transport system permease subunit
MRLVLTMGIIADAICWLGLALLLTMSVTIGFIAIAIGLFIGLVAADMTKGVENND